MECLGFAGRERLARDVKEHSVMKPSPHTNAVVQALGPTFNVYHAYDASNGGIPTLRISQLVWQDGWPVSAEPEARAPAERAAAG